MNMNEKVEKAHKHSIRHRNEIELSQKCGCFYCGLIFTPNEIKQWIDKNGKGLGQTALCPRCGIDSVIGDKSGFDIEESLLCSMHDRWFR